MPNNTYETSPNERVTQNGREGRISRPWGIYLVCVWFFFSVGNLLDGFALSISQQLFSNATFSILAGFVITYGLLGAMIIGMIKLKRPYLILGGTALITTGLFSLLSIFSLQELEVEPVVWSTIVIVTTAISAISAWYCLRPKFLKLADKYVAQTQLKND